ncbi:YhcH/YjgK/YiaL family protein [Adhaeribacter arboris]|uniref:YhcH/YjgK/YiaL family protein n=1 Tax=Adhaeribacter arboris TaxID=2072846 RepID=A0A2T2YFC8_9BACT|nr:YhcH/YjgK/YiaL family protein [Adhaeribacter arboris]PSR54226.1 YhcH/YjgK/YiaL family protein [Adhaeribacter arboris]
MIFDHLNNASRYHALHPDFALAFDFLKNQDVTQLATGKHALRDEEVFALLSDDFGFGGREQARLESHRRYLDIQVVLAGTDYMGWQDIAACQNVTEPYTPERDVIFYGDQPRVWLEVPAQHFVIFYPEDTHAPLATAEKVRKIVFKIAIKE